MTLIPFMKQIFCPFTDLLKETNSKKSILLVFAKLIYPICIEGDKLGPYNLMFSLGCPEMVKGTDLTHPLLEFIFQTRQA